MMPATKILIVEDEPVHAEALRHVIEHSEGGLRTELAATWQAASALLTRERFSLIVLDLCLPDVKGLDTVKRALTEANGTPIVIFTATGNQQTIEAARGLGVKSFLVKGDVDNRLLMDSIWRRLEEANRIKAESSVAQLHAELKEIYLQLGTVIASMKAGQNN